MQDSAPAINPFAAPAFVSEQTNSKVEGNNRASELVLNFLCSRLVIAELSFAVGCVSFFASHFWAPFLPDFRGNMEFQFILSYLPLASFAVTWICLFNIHRVVQGWSGAIGVLLTFPIPLIGTFIFRAESVHANVFLRHNGYRRTFLGGKPDPEERQLMESDLYYIPSIYFDKQGRRRSRRVFTLGDACLVAMIGFLAVTLVSS